MEEYPETALINKSVSHWENLTGEQRQKRADKLCVFTISESHHRK